MSLRILETTAAVEDVISTVGYIAGNSSLNASDTFLEAVKSTYRQIAEMPGIGSPRNYDRSNLSGVRAWRVSKSPKYLMFYLASETGVIILRVLHGARDIKSIFNPPDAE